MAKISIRMIADAPVASLPAGVAATDATTYGIFARDTQPVHLFRVVLAAGGTLSWTDGGRGYVVYVHSGEVESAGVQVGQGGSITIEHCTSARIVARTDSELLLFAQSAAGTAPERGTGGHIHILPADRVPRRRGFDGIDFAGGALYADAACESCALWLHETTVTIGGAGVDLHSHDEDEIIVTLSGEIVLGKRRYGPGTALFVARDTLYGFGTGPQGVTFINFRPDAPTYRPADRAQPSIDERQFNLQQLGHPAARDFASPAHAI